jgi:gas vesicle protein
MTRRQRRFDDAEFDFGGRRGTAGGVGTIFLATALGVGIGLLAAPDTGIRTRRRLRKRLETLGDDIGGGIEGVQGLSGRARERMRERIAQMRKRGSDAWGDLEERWHGEEEEEDDSGALGAVLAIAAGLAATYFFTSDRAAPARTRVRETAETMRREATNRWERYQQQRHERSNGQPGDGGDADETRSDAIPSDESPQAS